MLSEIDRKPVDSERCGGHAPVRRGIPGVIQMSAAVNVDALRRSITILKKYDGVGDVGIGHAQNGTHVRIREQWIRSAFIHGSHNAAAFDPYTIYAGQACERGGKIADGTVVGIDGST